MRCRGACERLTMLVADEQPNERCVCVWVNVYVSERVCREVCVCQRV
jgi:hypothetical protein